MTQISGKKLGKTVNDQQARASFKTRETVGQTVERL